MSWSMLNRIKNKTCISRNKVLQNNVSNFVVYVLIKQQIDKLENIQIMLEYFLS